MQEIEQLKEVFLTDVDPEDYEDNKRQIEQWQQQLTESEEYASWVDHPVTRNIAIQCRVSYLEATKSLALNRNLTDNDRASLWAKQDAALWLLSITEKDTKSAIAQIRRDIDRALNATK